MLRAILLSSAVFISPTQSEAAIAECSVPQGGVAVVEGVKIEAVASDDARFGMLRITARQGAFMHIYFDEQSEAVARQYASCFGTQLNLLADELLDEREGVQWASAVFSHDEHSPPPSGPGIKVRWPISTDPSASREQSPRPMIIGTISHEQVHQFQLRNHNKLPLWFLEGHATWSGLRIATMLDPVEGSLKREQMLAPLGPSSPPANLAGWGDRRPKREAILRQVSEEDRARMEADPDYFPAGPFLFNLDDFESDESNTYVRYAAALRMFEGLEQRHGADKVRRWVAEVTSKSDQTTDIELSASIRETFGEDMAVLLRG